MSLILKIHIISVLTKKMFELYTDHPKNGQCKLIYPEIKNVKFVFITVEENYPHGVITYELDRDFVNQGHVENFKSIHNYLNWDGDKTKLYDNTTVILRRPDWLAA